MITLEQAYDIAMETTDFPLATTAEDWGDCWVFDFNVKDILTGPQPPAIRKSDGKDITQFWPFFMEEHKGITPKKVKVSR